MTTNLNSSTASLCLLLALAVSPSVRAGSDSPAASPEGSVWQVESLDRGGIIDRSMVTLDFSEAGRIAGSGGCNRYFGAAKVDGQDLSLGAMGSSLRACAESLMNQERRFFQAMEAASSFAIEKDTWLVISDAAGQERIRAIRHDADSAATPSESLDQASTVLHSFTCEGVGSVSFRFVGPDTIALALPDADKQILNLYRAASGARYANEVLEFWNKGDEAMLTVGGVTHSCRKLGD